MSGSSDPRHGDQRAAPCEATSPAPRAPLGSRLSERFDVLGFDGEVPELRGGEPWPADLEPIEPVDPSEGD